MSPYTQFIKEYVKLIMQKRFDKRKSDISANGCSVSVDFIANAVQIEVVAIHSKVINSSIENDPTFDETICSDPMTYDATIILNEVTEGEYIDFGMVEDIVYELADNIINGQNDFENEQ